MELNHDIGLLFRVDMPLGEEGQGKMRAVGWAIPQRILRHWISTSVSREKISVDFYVVKSMNGEEVANIFTELSCLPKVWCGEAVASRLHRRNKTRRARVEEHWHLNHHFPASQQSRTGCAYYELE